METDLDLNGKRLLNYNPPKSKTVILGNYNKTSGMFKINDSDTFKFGFDFTIKKDNF